MAPRSDLRGENLLTEAGSARTLGWQRWCEGGAFSLRSLWEGAFLLSPGWASASRTLFLTVLSRERCNPKTQIQLVWAALLKFADSGETRKRLSIGIFSGSHSRILMDAVGVLSSLTVLMFLVHGPAGSGWEPKF